jgi:hypothetical protein
MLAANCVFTTHFLRSCWQNTPALHYGQDCGFIACGMSKVIVRG